MEKNISNINKKDYEKRIISPNFTQIPNVIFDYWIKKLDHSIFKVLLHLCRKTFGWHTEKVNISKKVLAEETGVSKRTVDKAIEILISYELIECYQVMKENEYSVNCYKIKIYEEDAQTLREDSATSARDPVQPGHQVPGKEKESNKEKEIIYINKNINKHVEPHDSTCLSIYLFKKLKELRPNRKPPNFNQWNKSFDYMLRIDKIPKEKIKQAIDYAIDPSNKFVVESPQSLRKKYENIADHMELERNLPLSKNKKIEENRIHAMKILSNFKELAAKKEIQIDVSSSQIIFIHYCRGAYKPPISVKFTENGFKEQIDSLMRKWKLI